MQRHDSRAGYCRPSSYPAGNSRPYRGWLTEYVTNSVCGLQCVLLFSARRVADAYAVRRRLEQYIAREVDQVLLRIPADAYPSQGIEHAVADPDAAGDDGTVIPFDDMMH